MDKTMPAARYPQRGQDWRSIALVAEAMGLWPIFPGEVRADVPLGDEGERYRLEIMPSAGASRTVESVLPGYDYGPVEQAADGSGGAASVTIPLSQIGVIAPSLPVISRTFTL
jgi:hypothetical protein